MRLSDYRLIKLDTVDSTNNYARDLFEKDPDSVRPVLISANEQTSGRGRYGRSFASPADSGIYMTYSFCPSFPEDEIRFVTPVTACIVHRVLVSSVPNDIADEIGIKWVNDIYRGDLKISGILTECITDDASHYAERIMIGIGINCYPGNFTEELSGIAGCLVDNESSIDKDELLISIANEICSVMSVETIRPLDFLEYYREHSILTDKEITVSEVGMPPYTGTAKGISNDYELIVKCDDGTERTLSSGVVSISLL